MAWLAICKGWLLVSKRKKHQGDSFLIHKGLFSKFFIYSRWITGERERYERDFVSKLFLSLI